MPHPSHSQPHSATSPSQTVQPINKNTTAAPAPTAQHAPVLQPPAIQVSPLSSPSRHITIANNVTATPIPAARPPRRAILSMIFPTAAAKLAPKFGLAEFVIVRSLITFTGGHKNPGDAIQTDQAAREATQASPTPLLIRKTTISACDGNRKSSKTEEWRIAGRRRNLKEVVCAEWGQHAPFSTHVWLFGLRGGNDWCQSLGRGLAKSGERQCRARSSKASNVIGGRAFLEWDECPPNALKSTASIAPARDRVEDQISGRVYQGIDERSRQGEDVKEVEAVSEQQKTARWSWEIGGNMVNCGENGNKLKKENVDFDVSRRWL
ncbi:uncharacterized protein LACBIDRAFT_329242 [Laccaria bicolor S238N-H82]|uniref:Predicted protein n=1 Tax=Laccaria bicolor (strain S238N-H82 / ATCC MYA-4686) TaxID=486041 RepID=B0DHH2_LACBS|nr:uncharacterized protein LACBIDRAFT_329242 [Laccaria bicolor S238N-H82]EDR06021.1 predicted protein [Laccaria bicolor S238N-H82]|eukprot:XP_001883309.1 predicted protein [Laccaria bicolor S238N-H82]